jgi:5-methyltetrahydrofolate corrinoid/iron sulfur protein methyltransferase
MYVIGELINGMFSNVKKAIQAKEGQIIQDLAKAQVDAGATALDVNVGPATREAVWGLLWLVENIRKVSDIPVAIDNAKWDVMQEVVPQVPGDKIINSSKADEELLDKYVPLAVENNVSLIALTLDQVGVPNDVDRRVELAATILTKCAEHGLDTDKLFIDPIILPVNVAGSQAVHVLRALEQMRMLSDPAPHFVLGLSNLSQNCANRSLINRVYLAMARGAGLDAAIMDPLDTELMDVAITTDLLCGQTIYCDSFLEAARSK